jgi:two-component system, NarL family, sensor kinase
VGRVRAALSWFVVGNVIAFAVVMVGGFFVLRSIAIDEATRDTRDRVLSEGRLAEAVGLTDGLLRGDPASIRQMDALVKGEVLSDSIVRVKVWARDGTILYSDEPRLIGDRFTLGPDELALFGTDQAEADLSDLSRPENRYERPQGKLLEAHTAVRTPNGTEVLFEIYQRFSAVSASGTRLLGALAPPLLGGAAILLLFQVPLAWTVARQMQRGHRDREQLLANAVEASTQERRRIAADLHDGVVQDLAGVAFGLAPLTAAARRRGDTSDAEVLQNATATLRQGVRDLRTLLLEIYPPNLEAAGLAAALSDLLSPLEAHGIVTSLRLSVGGEPRSHLDPHPSDALVYRVAREAIRNAQTHAAPAAVSVVVTRDDPCTRLEVTDDGVGFAMADRRRRGSEGHVGLTLLQGVVTQAGGTLDVRSAPGAGTTVTLELAQR